MSKDLALNTIDSGDFFQSLELSPTTGYFVCDKNQKILKLNSALCKMLHQTSLSSVVDHFLHEFFFVRKPIKLNLANRSLEDTLGLIVEWAIKNPIGTVIPCLVSINKYQAEDTGLYVGLVINIDKVHNSETRLKREYSLLERYLYITNSLIIELDEFGNILAFNHKAEELTGYSAQEALGKSWFDLILPASQVSIYKANWAAIFSEKKELEEFFTHKITAKDGDQKVIRWHSIFNYDKHKNHKTVLASGMDITALKDAEMKLQHLNLGLEKEVANRTQELVQVVNRLLSTNKQLDREIIEREKAQTALQRSQEKLQSSLEKEMELNSLKSRFLSMASHEFRTPLATILSSVSLLERYDGDETNEKKQKHYIRIKRSMNDLTQMLDDFFSISSFEDGKISYSPIPIDLHEFCLKVVDSFQNIMKSGQSLIYESAEKGLQLHSDPKLLKNVLINLLSNASKYSEDGQAILLKVRVDQQHIYFDVVDQGFGIPEEEQKYLFTRFFRANNVGNIKGTGIGLNIVKEYLKLLDGEITMHSELSKGSTFTVSIPKTKPL